NYLLVTSKLGDIYFEYSSPEPIYFPYINIVAKDCRLNPGNIGPQDNYIIFNDKSYDMDKVNKCAMESLARGYNKFGIMGEKCIPMSECDYTSFKSMETSNNCRFGEGCDTCVSGYIIGAEYS